MCSYRILIMMKRLSKKLSVISNFSYPITNSPNHISTVSADECDNIPLISAGELFVDINSSYDNYSLSSHRRLINLGAAAMPWQWMAGGIYLKPIMARWLRISPSHGYFVYPSGGGYLAFSSD